MREKSYQLFQDFLLSNNNDEEVELYYTRTKTDYGQLNLMVKYKLTINFRYIEMYNFMIKSSQRTKFIV